MIRRFRIAASDNAAGGRRLAEFLLAGGHRKIAHIAGWKGASTQQDRETGFLSGLAACGKGLHSRAIGNFHAECQPANHMVEETLRMILARIETPDAPARRVTIDGSLIVCRSARIPQGWAA